MLSSAALSVRTIQPLRLTRPAAPVRRRSAEALLLALVQKQRIVDLASRRWAPHTAHLVRASSGTVDIYAARRSAPSLSEAVFALHDAQRRINEAIGAINEAVASLPGTVHQAITPFDAVAHPAFSALGADRCPRRFDPACSVRLDLVIEEGFGRFLDALQRPIVDAVLARLVRHGRAPLLAWMGEEQLRCAIRHFLISEEEQLQLWLADLHLLTRGRAVPAAHVIEDLAAGVGVGGLRRRFDRFLDRWGRTGRGA